MRTCVAARLQSVLDGCVNWHECPTAGVGKRGTAPIGRGSSSNPVSSATCGITVYFHSASNTAGGRNDSPTNSSQSATGGSTCGSTK